MTKICLNSIVKNESKIIKRMLEHLKDFISYYVILDTGSTDNTIELIEEFTRETNIKGEIYKSQFINFSQARNEALKYCQSSLEDFDYILLCDADMNLKIKSKFNLNDDAYYIVQKNSTLEYKNIRLIKKGIKAEYKCPTHEYLDIGNVNIITLNKDEIYFDDVGDGGSKSEKYIRDIKILEDENLKNPNNPRVLFYLAQSYQCYGDHYKAIELYEKRTKVSGWNEEKFISWYRIGNIYYEELSPKERDYDKAIRAYLKAISTNPERLEPIFKLTKMTRESGDLNLSQAFSKMFKNLNAKNEFLFCEPKIYELYFLAEYWLLQNKKKYHKDIYSYDEFLLSRELKKTNYYNILSINYFNKWIEEKKNKLEVLAKFNFINEESNFKSIFNPSITLHKGEFITLLRNTNYKLTIDNNRLYYKIYDDGQLKNISDEIPLISRSLQINATTPNLEILNFRLPYNNEHFEPNCIQGIEDIRILSDDKNIYYIGNTLETKTRKNKMVVIKRDEYENLNYYVLDYEPNLTQKNWSPFIWNNQLYLVYSFDPLIILKFNPNNKSNVEEYCNIKNEDEDKDLTDARGGSQGVEYDEGNFIFIVHFTIPYNGRSYYHRMVILNVIDMSIEMIYEPFYIEKKGIEYISGFCKDKENNYYLSYGVDDEIGIVSKLKCEILDF